jgi:branched-chain amino acid transport system permease protein
VTGVETKNSAAATVAGQRIALLRRPERPVHLSVTVVFVLFAVFVLPSLTSAYYMGYITLVAIYSIVTLGLGLLVGRVGLYSLGQGAVLQVGAWTAARLLYGTGQPFPLVLIEAGLVTMVIGTLIGLPAIRLRGLYLALITLMFAGAITVVLATVNFPNGGGGFTGYDGGLMHIPPIRRPSIAGTDAAYYRYAVVVALLMFILVYLHLRTRPGRSWAAIRQSEPAALAAGISTTFYKLWAWALASFITGVAGGLFAGKSQLLVTSIFTTQDSIILLAVALMGGVFNLWGAVIAALLMQLVPGVLQNLGVSNAWQYILFGVGVLQVLTTAPAGIADQFPKDMKRLGLLLWRLVRRPSASGAHEGAPATSGTPATPGAASSSAASSAPSTPSTPGAPGASRGGTT